MYLKSLYLRNFRNYTEAEAHFSPHLNVFYGDNGQGKTSLLEAIYLIASGRSFRTQHLNELIKEGASFFFIEARIVQSNVEQSLKLSFDGQARFLQMSGNSYNTFHPLLGLLPSVLYTPNDMELISGSPSARRRFLNLHLAQSDPLYVHHLTRYWRAMKQRNCLLRMKKKEEIDCWEMEMAQSSAYLFKIRQEMLTELKEPLEHQSKILSSDKETHEIRFQPSTPSDPERYLKQLQKNRPREMDLGLTLTGPHRDDLSILIQGRPARLFASEGQKKTAIAALKMAEQRRLCNRIHAPAIMGIDDLGLHLDETRQILLRAALENLGQVFVTTPYLPSIWKELEKGLHIRVENGSIK